MQNRFKPNDLLKTIFHGSILKVVEVYDENYLIRWIDNTVNSSLNGSTNIVILNDNNSRYLTNDEKINLL